MSGKELRNWRPGTPLTARQLQEPVDAVRELRRRTLPADQVAASPDDDQTVSVNEVWIFDSSVTRTERLEDADDPDIYIDQEIPVSVTVRRPDGTTVRIELE